MRPRLALHAAALLALAALAGGCFSAGETALDEQKDPHFLAGRRHLNSFNYTGAAESFERALENNPRSASAHFELAVLHEQKLPGPNAAAVAIYHYDRFLQFAPQSERAELVRQRILSCRHEIARPVALAPGAQSVLRDLERLRIENEHYRQQLQAWAGWAASQRQTAPPETRSLPPPVPPGPPASNTAAAPRPAAPVRTHKVEAGENPRVIAKKYGVSVDALMAANPGVDARRIKVGQSLNIPAR
jgi:tetratricopeptide (TPR) repeat protein